ncbi:Sec23-binding domain of Sec16-domain-containing protein [Pisolithus croceorrhizus]|nr:Sec23-binding domain of Sec16-domain-containing protein [Pisolithus croceorrhizus]
MYVAVRSAFTSDHDPYRPSPEGHRQPSSAPSYAQAQPPYDPYKPSTTTAYTHHTPVVSGAQITRESYKPISRSVSSPYAPTSVAPPLALPPQPVAEGNTPPAATTAASYRPKTSNAYDPPLPPPRVAKRAVTTGHQTHGQTAAPPKDSLRHVSNDSLSCNTLETNGLRGRQPLGGSAPVSGPFSRPAYAPSPSLLGSNDPLGPFGFGGKLDLSTGFDVLPEYALEPQAALYPGPLFSDPGSPVTSLVRTGMSSNLKTKKARVIKYLEERAVEMSRGATYASEGFERRKVEDKLALVQVLKAMVEYDGVLHGSPQIDSAIRAALVPYIGDNINEAGKESSASLSTSTFTPPFADGYSTSLPTTNETLISVTATRPSALDKIQEFLAYHYALDEKLWAHAMVISSSIDKEAWKEVVGEFLKAELGVHDPQHALVTRGNDSVPPRTNGRECLRVVYSLFSGQGPAAIQELLESARPLIYHTVTPMSPNFPSAAAAAQVPSESLLKWPEIVASVLTNVSNPEWSAAITALGDYLLSHQQVEAAHVCYMLSPQTSIIGGVGSPSARIILLGSQSPHSKPTFSTPKGQESFLGFPHLQAYKLIRAVYLAEIGHVQAASRYCEAITASMSRPSPYFNPVMVGQLRSLAERLMGAP